MDDGEIALLYGNQRIAYVIDRQGVIRFIQQGVPDNQRLLQELEKL